MNKNDKFHGAEFEVNAQAVTDEKLEGVAGGNNGDCKECPYCHNWYTYFDAHVNSCSKNPANHSSPRIPSGLYTQNS